MDRVFVDDIVLEGDNYKHLIRVRRLKENDVLEIVLDDKVYLSKIVSVDKKSANLEIVEQINVPENLVEITLYQSIIDKKKMETVFKLCTALGVKKFVPILSEYVGPTKNLDFDNDRNYEILKEAAQQSKGNFIPKINKPMKFKDAIKNSRENDLSIILYENEDTCYIKDVIDDSIKSIGIFVGPEGGFSKDEVDFAKSNNVKSTRLFSRILRSELAGFSAASIINANMEAYEGKN